MGRRILHSAREAGYVRLKQASPKALMDSQFNLLNKRRAVLGRLAAMKWFGLPTPRLAGSSLYDNWRKLPWKEKLRSTMGTARRIVTRRYYRKLNFSQGRSDDMERGSPQQVVR
jgi:coenzyme F420 hydrogenase subunit beta